MFFRDVFWYLDVFSVMFFGTLMFFSWCFLVPWCFVFWSFLALWCFFRDVFWHLDVSSWSLWQIDFFHEVYLYIYAPDKKTISAVTNPHTRRRIPIGIYTDFFQSLLEQSHAYKVEIPIGILLNLLKSPMTKLQFSCESYLGHTTSQSPHTGEIWKIQSLYTPQ